MSILRPEEVQRTFRTNSLWTTEHLGTRQWLAVIPGDRIGRHDGGNDTERSHQPDRRRWTHQGYEAGGSKPSAVETIQGHEAAQPDCHVTSQDQRTREHLPVRREQHSHFLRREISYRATTGTFWNSDLDHRSDRERGRGGSVRICSVFALMLNINKRLLAADRRSGYSRQTMQRILLLFYISFSL